MIRNQNNNQIKWIRLVFLVMVWALTWSLYKDFAKVKKGYGRVSQASERLQKEQRDNVLLRNKVENTESEYFKERIIRDKLNMQLPGETLVVLAERNVATSEAVRRQAEATVNIPNWKKWLDLVW